MANDKYWQELFDSLDKMSAEEFEELLKELDAMPEVFAINDREVG